MRVNPIEEQVKDDVICRTQVMGSIQSQRGGSNPGRSKQQAASQQAGRIKQKTLMGLARSGP
jgi:hypothetical protein